jgi:hypothetical protein
MRNKTKVVGTTGTAPSSRCPLMENNWVHTYEVGAIRIGEPLSIVLVCKCGHVVRKEI